MHVPLGRRDVRMAEQPAGVLDALLPANLRAAFVAGQIQHQIPWQTGHVAEPRLKTADRHLATGDLFEDFTCHSEPVPVFQCPAEVRDFPRACQTATGTLVLPSVARWPGPATRRASD